MKSARTMGWLSAAALSAAVAGAGFSTMASAQENPGGNNPPPAAQNQDNGRRGGRRMDPAQFRERMMNRLKEQLGMSNDEFAAVQPKIEKVMELRRQASGRGMMGRRQEQNENKSAVESAREDLRKTLDDKNASADDIKAKLTSLRDAESKAQESLVKAQDDLKSVLTQRQEAVLVLDGMLR